MNDPQDTPTPTAPTASPSDQTAPPPLRVYSERETLLAAFAYIIGGWNASLGCHPGRLRGEPSYSDDEEIARFLLARYKHDIASPLQRAIDRLKAELHDAERLPVPIPALEQIVIPAYEDAETEYHAGGNDPVAMMVFHHEPGDGDGTTDNETSFRGCLRAVIEHAWTEGHAAAKREMSTPVHPA